MTFLLISIFVGCGPCFCFYFFLLAVLSLTLSCRLRKTESRKKKGGRSLTLSGEIFNVKLEFISQLKSNYLHFILIEFCSTNTA